MSGATQGDYVKVLMLDVELAPGKEWSMPTEHNATLFIYIVQGAGYFEAETQQVTESHRAVLFTDGDTFVARAADQGIRFILFSGQPLREPIAWGGPIVMNTRQELQEAFAELDNNTFIKENSKN